MDTPKNILITGASGLIGNRLTKLLQLEGHKISYLGRTAKSKNPKTFIWNIDKKILDVSALQGVDTIIHLAGAGVSDKRWTPARKQEILKSRTESTKLLYHTLKTHKH